MVLMRVFLQLINFFELPERARERRTELLLENVLTHIAGFFKVTQSKQFCEILT